MSQEKMIEEIVRQVLTSIDTETLFPNKNFSPSAESQKKGLIPDRDYPLACKRPELLKTPRGKGFKDITLDKLLKDELDADDLRITPETLRLQAEIADGVERIQFANNLRRAAELTAVPDARILEIYNALRPYRSTREELLDIANELESKYNAKINAAFVREAAEVYERRNRLRTE